jgi:hypothetical protein
MSIAFMVIIAEERSLSRLCRGRLFSCRIISQPSISGLGFQAVAKSRQNSSCGVLGIVRVSDFPDQSPQSGVGPINFHNAVPVASENEVSPAP